NLLTRVARPGEQRFRMLETLREYAREALAGDESAPQVHAGHAALYLARAEAAEAQLGGPQQQHWLAVLGDEHDNIRAALQWAIDHDDTPIALRLAGALVRFWDVRGFLTEGRFWLESALALPRNGVAAAVLLRALNAAATLARRQSDLAHSRALFEQALALSRAAGERWWESIVLNGLALVLRREGQLEQAAALFEQSLAVCRAVGNHQGAAAAIGNLGSIATLQGHTARAIDIQHQGLELARQQQNPREIAESLNNLATAYHAAGDWERADELQRESLELYRSLGDRYGMALVEYNLADRARAWGRLEQARTWCHHSLRTYDEIGEKAGVVECIELAACIAVRDNRADWAAQLLSAMDEQRVLLGAPRTTAEQADAALVLEVARSALGDALFGVAQSSGRHMALHDAAEQVLAYSAPPSHVA
ncbi:MAG TPA: tetratricopeptide repeat protein, partial [Roseiflexaceae bacterium]|nr:tetratricopeptide repeat protein [Roseiflexaceae bacterium]